MKSILEMVGRWWNGELGGAGDALDVITAPAEALYRGATNVRNALYDAGTLDRIALDVPVISVGNVAVGGTGKTPVTAWLARELRKAGRAPAVLHGGYADDEPALHREMNPSIPVHVGRDRVETGRAAIAAGANILVLDDAFQHRRLRRTLDIVLVAAETWNGRRRALPRGPWRESAAGLARAEWIVVTRRTASLDEARSVRTQLRTRFPDANVAIIHLAARAWRHAGREAAAPTLAAHALSAIASPDAFIENARNAGATVDGVTFFPDHHEYDRTDVDNVLKRAGTAPILTTAKDWVKLRHLLPADRVWVLMQHVEPEDDAEQLLQQARELAR
ncbi:MAG: tetraacyldisaccharide 4'-kinase [Longimicrobiales bacterium]